MRENASKYYQANRAKVLKRLHDQHLSRRATKLKAKSKPKQLKAMRA